MVNNDKLEKVSFADGFTPIAKGYVPTSKEQLLQSGNTAKPSAGHQPVVGQGGLTGALPDQGSAAPPPPKDKK